VPAACNPPSSYGRSDAQGDDGRSVTVAPPPEVRSYAEHLVSIAQDVLSEDLVGMYTTGSLALGGFVAGRSDIDIVVVADDATSPARRTALAERVRHPGLRCPAAGLELVVYGRAVASRPSREAAYLLEVNTGPELAPRVTLDPAGRPAFWFVIDRDIASQSGASLFGPPAALGIARLPRALMLAVIVESLDYQLVHLGDELGDSAVLNACRSLHFAEHGHWMNKPAAARWAMSRRDVDTGLIELARKAHSKDRRAATSVPAADARRLLAGIRDAVQSRLETA
jgi:hypothetical protein